MNEKIRKIHEEEIKTMESLSFGFESENHHLHLRVMKNTHMRIGDEIEISLHPRFAQFVKIVPEGRIILQQIKNWIGAKVMVRNNNYRNWAHQSIREGDVFGRIYKKY